jgi:hypothetical protein
MHGPKWAALSLLLGALGAAGAHAVAAGAPAAPQYPAQTEPAAQADAQTDAAQAAAPGA